MWIIAIDLEPDRLADFDLGVLKAKLREEIEKARADPSYIPISPVALRLLKIEDGQPMPETMLEEVPSGEQVTIPAMVTGIEAGPHEVEPNGFEDSVFFRMLSESFPDPEPPFQAPEAVAERKAEEEIERLRVASSQVCDNRPLVSFLYEMLRDHVQPGVAEAVVWSSKPGKTTFTNGWLAKYAQDIADRLVPTPQFHKAFFDAGVEAGLKVFPTLGGWRRMDGFHVYAEFRFEQVADLVTITVTGKAIDRANRPALGMVTLPTIVYEKVEQEMLSIERIDWLVRNTMDQTYERYELAFKKHCEGHPAMELPVDVVGGKKLTEDDYGPKDQVFQRDLRVRTDCEFFVVEMWRDDAAISGRGRSVREACDKLAMLGGTASSPTSHAIIRGVAEKRAKEGN